MTMAVNLMSPVDKIDHLLIHKLPTNKVVLAERVVSVDRVTLVLGKDGRIYCDSRQHDGSWTVSSASVSLPFIRALRALGVITAAEARRHVDAAKAAEQRKQRRFYADQLLRGTKGLGVKLTKAQERAVKAAGATILEVADGR